MSEPDTSEADPRPDPPGSSPVRPATDRDRQWMLTLLPAFPLVLLVLRLWVLSRQDLQTMLVLVQYVSPLGLVSSLVITLVWTPPALILTGRALGTLLRASLPDHGGARRPWLVRAGSRVPGWVVTILLTMGAVTWQMRFLPTLVMLTLAIIGLAVRHRHGDNMLAVRAACVALPLVVALLEYVWLAPGIGEAFDNGEILNGLLLLLPPGLAVLLTGPVPAAAARAVIEWPATVAALLAPVVFGAFFLRAPVLPWMALEVGGGTPATPVVVENGYVVTVDDTMTTLLDKQGKLRFVPNSDIRSKTLCPNSDEIPQSVSDVRGWPLETSALEFVAPSQRPDTDDPRCQGRPLSPPG